MYALGAIATKVAFWLPQAIGVVFYPRLADPAQSGDSLRQAVTVVAGIGVVLTVAAGLAGPLVPLVVGDDLQGIATVLRDVTTQKELERMKSNFNKRLEAGEIKKTKGEYRDKEGFIVLVPNN